MVVGLSKKCLKTRQAASFNWQKYSRQNFIDQNTVTVLTLIFFFFISAILVIQGQNGSDEWEQVQQGRIFPKEKWNLVLAFQIQEEFQTNMLIPINLALAQLICNFPFIYFTISTDVLKFIQMLQASYWKATVLSFTKCNGERKKVTPKKVGKTTKLAPVLNPLCKRHKRYREVLRHVTHW